PRHHRLISEYFLLISSGLRWIDGELRRMTAERRAAREAIRAEIAQASVSWMSYLVTEVELDRPFQLKTSELLPFREHTLLRRQKLRMWTYHRYHISHAEARSTHVEVDTDDPELVID